MPFGGLTLKEIILRVQNLKKWFPLGRNSRELFSHTRKYIRAVDNLNFTIEKETIFGCVGESGCGKTTTGRLLVRLVEPTSGEVFFKGQNIFLLRKSELRKIRRRMQIIFQNPYDCLDPRMKIHDVLAEPMIIHDPGTTRSAREENIQVLLSKLNLNPPEKFMGKYPRELSGGERQRIAIGRALVLQPEFIVADEPVSMLDASVRGEILTLIIQLQKQFQLSLFFISHDLAVARAICSKIAVMYLGKIVELGFSSDIVSKPLHPYMTALIDAVPIPDPASKRSQTALRVELSESTSVQSGCRFHPRCKFATDICRKSEPELREYEHRLIACHMADKRTL